MSNFITNSGVENLKQRINQLIKFSEELKFLVGFFYFSGLTELYHSLKQNPNLKIKILVGLNIDQINNKILELSLDEEKRLSDEEKRENFFNSIKRGLNIDDFDHKEFYEQIEFFIKLIKDGRLNIRKTFEPNHSKLYLFKLKESDQAKSKIFIVGSSNLTKSGLNLQNEFNVEISDYGFGEAEGYFDHLWEKSIPITEIEEYKVKLIKVIEEETLIKKPTPFEAYFYALSLYIKNLKRKNISQRILQLLEKNNYSIFKYQLDAVGQALSIIEEHNGVILADVVGLGKTIIACAIAKSLNKRGIIICPPTLEGDLHKKDMGWNMYKEQFELYDWEVWSLGKLEELNNQLKNRLTDIEVVIIDEAHRFRNQDTKSYSLLKNICRGKIIILLTATPFNNSPADIFSLLSLFITPKKSTITLTNNLVDRFRNYQTEFTKLSNIKKNIKSSNSEKKQKAIDLYQSIFAEDFHEESIGNHLQKVKERARYLAKKIRSVLEKVTIRRNRLDLKENPDYKDEVQNLSEVADPQKWFFELNDDQLAFYDKVITKYFANPEDGGIFKGAIYRPFVYYGDFKMIDEEDLTKEENREFLQQQNLYDFMRRLLVKRFESSFGSFKQSIINFYEVTKNALEFLKKTQRFILDRDLIEKIYYKEIEEIELYLNDYSQKILDGVYPKNHKIYDFSDKTKRQKFINDIQSDLNLFQKILNEVDSLNLINNDPKAEKLLKKIEEIHKNESNRKIIIFTEYLDTVFYLKEILKNKFSSKVLVVDRDLTQKLSQEIKENFDASSKIKKNDYFILLTSDKLSEGFNLNRAGIVINYDIPWNPVRVIQRLGRINRISKKVFDRLYIANFFPTEKGANLVKSEEIAKNKIFLIHNTLGEDAKIFDIDEEPEPSKLYQRLNENPEKNEIESFYTKAYKEYLKLKSLYPNLEKEITNFPPRIKVSKDGEENELIVFIKKRELHIVYQNYQEKKPKEVDFEFIFEKIKASKDTQRKDLSQFFWEKYYLIKNYKDQPSRLPEQSLEKQAYNNLRTLLNLKNQLLLPHKSFIRILLDDIENYGTLPDYDLRVLAYLEFSNNNQIKKTINTLKKFEEELGFDYLEKEKVKNSLLSKEIIIAIENQKQC